MCGTVFAFIYSPFCSNWFNSISLIALGHDHKSRMNRKNQSSVITQRAEPKGTEQSRVTETKTKMVSVFFFFYASSVGTETVRILYASYIDIPYQTLIRRGIWIIFNELCKCECTLSLDRILRFIVLIECRDGHEIGDRGQHRTANTPYRIRCSRSADNLRTCRIVDIV